MKTSLNVIVYLCDALSGLVSSLAADFPSLSKTGIGDVAAQVARDAKLLGQAYSDMALRNLLADLLRGVRRIEAVQPTLNLAHLSKATVSSGGGARQRQNAVGPDDRAETCMDLCADLVKRLDAELREHSPSRARYSQVVCIGYRVKVAGNAYSGSTDDSVDMRRRCDDLKKAIQAAYALADQGGRKLNSYSNHLKVFMAPEFFFRGANGAYDHAVVHGNKARTDAQGRVVQAENKGLVEIMLEELNKPCYKDWLFVLGTAIAATEESVHRCAYPGCEGRVVFDVDRSSGRSKPRCSADSAHRVAEKRLGAFVENVGFVVKEGEVHTVSKELVSHIDYVKDKARGETNRVTVTGSGSPVELSVRRHDQPSGYKSATDVPSRFTDERMGGCIFTIDGITIGVEVCLDHDASTSSRSEGRLNHAANIQLQLIPSAGMSIRTLRTVQGGLVFNVDGLTPHVHVAGGKQATAILNYDDSTFKFGKMSWSDLKLAGSSGKKLQELEALNKAEELNEVPVQGPGGSGTVVLFGPFEIARP